MNKDRVVVYLVNEHPFYLFMAANSIAGLRRYNATVKVRVFLVEDGAAGTMGRKNMGSQRLAPADFRAACEKINVEVVRTPPLDLPGEEGYFYAQRHAFKDVPEPTVLHMDGDTFIFGDVEGLMDRYADADLAASDNGWVWSRGFTTEMLPVRPVNSGVVIWRNGHLRRWAAELPALCLELRTADTPLAAWLRHVSPECTGREEFSVTLYAVRNGLTIRTFPDEEVRLIRTAECLPTLGRQVVFHSYTDHWREAYGLLNKPRPGKVMKYVRRT